MTALAGPGLRRPPRLREGDSIAIVAPSGPVPHDGFERGARLLEAHFSLVYDGRIFDGHPGLPPGTVGYLAGDDEARLGELRRAIEDPSIAGVMCARGGYGLGRIIERLPRGLLAAHPKPIVGFSDITMLHAWAARDGVASIHGPVVTQLGALPDSDAAALLSLLESPDPPPALTGLEGVAPASGPSTAEGWLFGGNLELLSRLCGTPSMPSLAGAVLLLEEVGERPYRIDRALTQLRESGALAGVRGAVIGDLVRCAESTGSPPSAMQVVVERLGHSLGLPLVLGAPIGHGERNRAVPLGARVRLDAGCGRLDFEDGAVA